MSPQPGPKTSPAPSSTNRFPAAGRTSRASPPGPAALSRSSAPTPTCSTAAAWLHDIGYAPDLHDTGLHPPRRRPLPARRPARRPMLCRLVAHHSCAIIEAEERGLADVLTREFKPAPRSAGRRADLLRHDHQPRRPAHARRPAAGRYPRPLRPRSSCHPGHRPLGTAAHRRSPPGHPQATRHERRSLGRSEWPPAFAF